MFVIKFSVALSIVCMCLTPAMAQSTLTLPVKGIQPREGMGMGLIVPALKWLPARQQCFYAASDLPSAPIAIREVAFQPNAPKSFGLDAVTVTLTLDLSMGPRLPRKFSRTFSENLGKTVTRVFSGKIQLPKITDSTKQGWYFRIPFRRPVLASAKLGSSLVLDFSTSAVTSKMNRRWELLQGLRDTGSGGFQGVGYNCHFKKIPMLFQTLGGSWFVGSKWSWRATPLLVNQPGFLTIGDAGWGAKWAGLTFPIGLKPFGASGCTWDVRPILSIPFVVNGFGQTSLIGMRIPNNMSFANVKFYLQGAYAYPGANALGWLFLPSLELRIGSGEDTNAATLGWGNNNPSSKLGNSMITNPAPYCRITY